MPKAAASGALEKLCRFDGHALIFSACHKGKDKNDQLGESEFAGTSKIGVGQFCFRIDIFGNDFEEKLN